MAGKSASVGGVSGDPQRTATIQKMESPQNAAAVRSLLGMLNASLGMPRFHREFRLANGAVAPFNARRLILAMGPAAAASVQKH